jgi:hypothetical protein
MTRPLAALFALLPSLALAGGLEMVRFGPQSLEGVLVTHEGRYQLLLEAGTKEQRVYEARVAPGKEGLAAALKELVVTREAVPLVGETEMVQKGGLFVPVVKPPENPYPAKLFRHFRGTVNKQAEFVIDSLEPRVTGPALAKLLVAARQAARDRVAAKDDPNLTMAFTVLERMGVMDEVLADVAAILAEADPAAEGE